MAARIQNVTWLLYTALGIALVVAASAGTADVTIQLDAGGGLSVRNSTGAIERLRVDEANGNISRNGALFIHTTGGTAFGAGALSVNTLGGANSAFGLDALRYNSTGTANSAFGDRALRVNTMGFGNSAFGASALRSNTTGPYNSALGGFALLNNTTGAYNSAVGRSSLRYNTTGSSNSAFGYSALRSSNGSNNAAFGASALRANTTGAYNSAFGEAALGTNTTGRYNSAFGRAALFSNTTGFFNTGAGQYALLNNTSGGFNTALGQKALNSNTTGSANTGVGQGALFYNTSGSNNVALGKYAGISQTTGNDNIYLANFGAAGESGFIRIGTVGTHTRAFIAGISGIAIPSGSPVFVNSSGLLGTASVSSERFKRDVRDMGKASDVLMKLRPVSFRYREDAVGAAEDAEETEYGLIAEEVAKVAPELVTPDLEGRPYTVKYHELPALLLNQNQEQQRTIEALLARTAALERALAAQGKAEAGR